MRLVYPLLHNSVPLLHPHPARFAHAIQPPSCQNPATFKKHPLFLVTPLCHLEFTICHLQIFLLIPVFPFTRFAPTQKSITAVHYSCSRIIFVTIFLQIVSNSRVEYYSIPVRHSRTILITHLSHIASIQHSLLRFS